MARERNGYQSIKEIGAGENVDLVFRTAIFSGNVWVGASSSRTDRDTRNVRTSINDYLGARYCHDGDTSDKDNELNKAMEHV